MSSSSHPWNVTPMRDVPVQGESITNAYIQQQNRSLPDLDSGFRVQDADRFTHPYPSYLFGGEIRMDSYQPMDPEQQSFEVDYIPPNLGFVSSLDLPSSRIGSTNEDGIPVDESSDPAPIASFDRPNIAGEYSDPNAGRKPSGGFSRDVPGSGFAQVLAGLMKQAVKPVAPGGAISSITPSESMKKEPQSPNTEMKQTGAAGSRLLETTKAVMSAGMAIAGISGGVEAGEVYGYGSVSVSPSSVGTVQKVVNSPSLASEQKRAWLALEVFPPLIQKFYEKSGYDPEAKVRMMAASLSFAKSDDLPPNEVMSKVLASSTGNVTLNSTDIANAETETALAMKKYAINKSKQMGEGKMSEEDRKVWTEWLPSESKALNLPALLNAYPATDMFLTKILTELSKAWKTHWEMNISAVDRKTLDRRVLSEAIAAVSKKYTSLKDPSVEEQSLYVMTLASLYKHSRE